MKKLYSGTINDFEYHDPTDAENSVCELVSLVNEDRKQELIRLIYYFLTQATKQFIDTWLYMLLISLYPKSTGIESLDKSEADFFAGFSKYEISILNKTINYFLNQYPHIMSQKEKENLKCYWRSLKKINDNDECAKLLYSGKYYADADIPGFLATCKRENVAVWQQHFKPEGNMTNPQMMS